MPDNKGVKACIFHCSEAKRNDRLSHYCKCKPLWEFVCSTCSVDIKSDESQVLRLGATLDKRYLVAVALASHIYHTIRVRIDISDSHKLHREIKAAAKTFCMMSKRVFFPFAAIGTVWKEALFTPGFWQHSPDPSYVAEASIQEYVPGTRLGA